VDVDVELLGELGFEVEVVDAVAKLAAELAEGRDVHCLSVVVVVVVVNGGLRQGSRVGGSDLWYCRWERKGLLIVSLPGIAIGFPCDRPTLSGTQRQR